MPLRYSWSTLILLALAISACANALGIQDYTFGSGDAGGSTTGTAPNTSGVGVTSSNGATTGSGSGSSGSSSAGVTTGASGASTTGSTGAGAGSASGAQTAGATGASAGTTGASTGTTGTSTGSTAGSGSGSTAGAGSTGSFSGSATGSSAGSSTGSTTGSTGSTTGGTTGSAGMTGSSSGGSSGTSTGGPATCDYGTAYNGSGSFTYYWFGQGTSKGPNGDYLTACGYMGTESGMVDTVKNTANSGAASNTYFAAIPGSNGFDTVNDCGACVEITNGGNKVIATIIDECPTDNGQNPPCKNASHLDLSYSAWKKLGYSVGNPSNTTWKFIACPVTGNIQTIQKSGNSDQVYIENTVFPVTKVTVNGQAAKHLSYGVWSLNGTNAAGATLALTDVEGHTVTGTVPGGFGDMGVQFPTPGTCP